MWKEEEEDKKEDEEDEEDEEEDEIENRGRNATPGNRKHYANNRIKKRGEKNMG